MLSTLSRYRFHNPLIASMAALALKYGSRMEGEDDDDDDDGGGASEEELAAQARRLLDKQGGSAEALAIHLLTDNRKVRAKARKAVERANAAEAKVPKDGQVVVSKDDADALTAYKAFGKPEEVKAKIEKGVTLEATNVERERSESIASAATLAQIPNGKLLGKLADPKRETFVIELRDEVKDGKSVKVPFARKNEDKAAWMPLLDFAKKELVDYMPALLAKGESGNGSENSTTHTAVPDQTTSSTAPATGVVDKFIEQRNKAAAARPNPLAPQAPAKTTT